MKYTFDRDTFQERLNAANDLLFNEEAANNARTAAENEYFVLQTSHMERLAEAYTQQLNLQRTQRLAAEEEVYKIAIKKGRDLSTLKAQLNAEEQRAEEREKAKIEAKNIKKRKDLTNKQKREKLKDLKQEADKEYNFWKSGLDKKEKQEIRKNKRAETQVAANRRNENAGKLRGALAGENKIGKTLQALGEIKAKDGSGAAFTAALTAVSDMTKQLNAQIDTIASKKGAIDTRLQGSKNKTFMGSYWDKMSQNITGIAGVSPLVKQEAIVEKLQTLVGKGISFNVEQRAFLDTIKDKIATTFEAADGTLLKLVRIQQADTTAARLGMESALTAFLNNMYETTEYMTDAAATIRGNLYAATALMGAESATEFEYQVQKWMGSLYSVGMSQEAVSSLSGALGKIAAGDVSGITSGGAGNLMIMAANNAGINIADALADGLDASKTNQLMSAMVSYLSKIYDESQNSKVIQQQFANVYGITAADLKAAKSLMGSNKNIYDNNLNYGGMLKQLNNMAGSMYSRTSIGELMSNAFANLKYTMSAGIANNPVLYGLFKTANMLDDLVGGIDFSMPLVMGSGTTQTFNVADLMRVGALSGSVLSGMVNMLKAGSGAGGISGVGMLKALGVQNGTAVVGRGTGEGLLSQGPAVEYSESGYIGNENNEDMLNKTMGDQKESSKNETAQAADDSKETTLTTVNENVVAILSVLNDVTGGTKAFKVDLNDVSAWTNAMGGL